MVLKALRAATAVLLAVLKLFPDYQIGRAGRTRCFFSPILW